MGAGRRVRRSVVTHRLGALAALWSASGDDHTEATTVSTTTDRRGAGDTGSSQSSYGRRVTAKFIINPRGRYADGDRAP